MVDIKAAGYKFVNREILVSYVKIFKKKEYEKPALAVKQKLYIKKRLIFKITVIRLVITHDGVDDINELSCNMSYDIHIRLAFGSLFLVKSF